MKNESLPRTVSADAEDWQTQCWNLAKAKAQFALEKYVDGFHPFFNEISIAYRYEIKLFPSKILFIPPQENYQLSASA